MSCSFILHLVFQNNVIKLENVPPEKVYTVTGIHTILLVALKKSKAMLVFYFVLFFCLFDFTEEWRKNWRPKVS